MASNEIQMKTLQLPSEIFNSVKNFVFVMWGGLSGEKPDMNLDFREHDAENALWL